MKLQLSSSPWFNILLPSLILFCASFIVGELSSFNAQIKSILILYFPISFGFVIGLVNKIKYRYNYYWGILLSLTISCIIFFLVLLISHLLTIIKDNSFLQLDFSKEKIFLFTVFFIAPLLTFLGYSFMFKILKNKRTLLLILVVLCLMYLVKIINFSNSTIGFLTDPTNRKIFLNPYILWQLIMVFGLQLIIYQKELIKVKNK